MWGWRMDRGLHLQVWNATYLYNMAVKVEMLIFIFLLEKLSFIVYWWEDNLTQSNLSYQITDERTTSYS